MINLDIEGGFDWRKRWGFIKQNKKTKKYFETWKIKIYVLLFGFKTKQYIFTLFIILYFNLKFNLMSFRFKKKLILFNSKKKTKNENIRNETAYKIVFTHRNNDPHKNK